ncbi:metal-binding protein ZinT [Moellerella wisconsensis]|uniref:Putative zinc-binding lipoprotein n=1 Tax=Moellerella wisconsensis ATCC 35017 TaxID=1354267 RepID=A0A0N0Z7P4_9GAMM|nr:metal-binding protein ZinT [Moellerella wisconsensis]KPD02695.1 putative zinc-binding lipoprotein [Moellerella wisconsensis ATCC 35017]
MTRNSLFISLVALAGSFSFFSISALAHGGHSHSHPPQTEEARLASDGIFKDDAVKNRPLSNWDGVWQSVNPYLLNGDLDPVLQAKAQKDPQKTVEQYRQYYKMGYATDIDMIGIEDNVIEFHQGDKVSACEYHYSGFKILHYASGKKGVRYLFECAKGDADAPKYVQFSDHIIQPQQSAHFHIYMGNSSQEKLLEQMDNWPTYYPYSLNAAQIVDEMLHH